MYLFVYCLSLPLEYQLYEVGDFDYFFLPQYPQVLKQCQALNLCEGDTLVLVEPCLSINHVLGAMKTLRGSYDVLALRKLTEELELVRNLDLILPSS